MRLWTRILIEVALGWWLRRQRTRTTSKLKIKGLKIYLKILQGARLSVIGIVAILFTLQLMALGLVLTLGAGVYLLPLPDETKIWIVFGVGSIFFLLPLVLLSIFLSERLWYQASGASDLVKDALKGGHPS